MIDVSDDLQAAVVTDEDYDFPAAAHEYEEYDEPCPVLQPREELEDYDDPVQSYWTRKCKEFIWKTTEYHNLNKINFTIYVDGWLTDWLIHWFLIKGKMFEGT